jgi:hypothetical protein
VLGHGLGVSSRPVGNGDNSHRSHIVSLLPPCSLTSLTVIQPLKSNGWLSHDLLFRSSSFGVRYLSP